MDTKTTKVLILFLTICVVICAILLIRQTSQMGSLQEQLLDQGAQLKLLQDELAHQSTLVSKVGEALEVSQARLPSNIKMRSLNSGVYKLTTEVTVDPFEARKDDYTIYNFVLDLRVGAVRRKLQFGYASSGFFTHVIYFDHDSDGTVDTKMMSDYVDAIPGGALAANWLIEPEHSQAVYNAFRLNVDLAEQLTQEDITNSANTKIGILWTWLNEESEQFSDWVEEAIEFD